MISRQDARRLVLNAQGLGRRDPFGLGPAAVQRVIEHLSYIQIDTISVVERAHHHVVWNRVSDYAPPVLHRLQAEDRTVFEYWSHAAAFLPIRDFRFSLPRKKLYADGERHWFRHNKKVMKLVLERIQAEGPLQAKDFEAPRGRKSAGWFDWKPAKIALEQLYLAGALMVRERKGFQKVYDLTERVLPPGVDTRFPSAEEIARHWIENALRSQGLCAEPEIRYLRKGHRKELMKVLREMEEDGKIVRLSLEGDEKTHYYAEKETLSGLSSRRTSKYMEILSPFDSLVIQRKRLQKIFDFDYQIECYVPAPKRKYGYFCLPVLSGDRLVGRIDAKADREAKKLVVKRLFIESADFDEDSLDGALQRFSEFNGCSEYKIERVRRIKSSISS